MPGRADRALLVGLGLIREPEPGAFGDPIDLRTSGRQPTPRAFGRDWRLPIVNRFRVK